VYNQTQSLYNLSDTNSTNALIKKLMCLLSVCFIYFYGPSLPELNTLVA